MYATTWTVVTEKTGRRLYELEELLRKYPRVTLLSPLALPAVLRIRDVYSGCQIQSFPSRIPVPWSKRSRIRIKEFEYFKLSEI
jgi:hypothetical protein